MRLERGSELRKEEVRDKERVRQTVLDDLLADQLKEREKILCKKRDMLLRRV